MLKYFYKTTLPLPSIILLISGLLISGCGSPSAAADPGLIQVQAPKPVILDVDMAHEDMFSALFLLSHPNADLRAITVSGTGEAHCEPGVKNALGLVAVSGHKEIPVACGRDTPSSSLVHEMLTANLGFVDSGGFQFWDSLTAAISTDPSIAVFEEVAVRVLEEQGPESGRTKPAPDGTKIKVAMSADRKTFEQILLAVWNWRE